MNENIEFERCESFINCQLKSPHLNQPEQASAQRWRAVTISRQTGCGARALADRLAAELQSRSRRDAQPWMIFDRNLVERVIKEHDLPASVATYLREDRVSELDDIMEELFGLHPSSWELVRETSETILHLAELGNVILIGRGANIVTTSLPFVFHVRLIGSLENRIERLRQERKQSAKAALAFLQTEERARQRYLKKYFNTTADDPMLYHLVINTDLITAETAAGLIANALRKASP